MVSVGLTDGKPKGSAKAINAPLVNANIDLAKLKAGLDLVAGEDEPTMIVVPDAVLLKDTDNKVLNQAILAQCKELMSRVGLIDIPGGDDPDPNNRNKVIDTFRTAIGTRALSYGIAYYPFLKSAVMTDKMIDFHNLGGGSRLAAVLPKLEGAAATALAATLGRLDKAELDEFEALENTLLRLSDDYERLRDAVLAKMNILPPAAAMAGVFTYIDKTKGVWQAPANCTLSAVADTTLKISHSEQADLNVHAATGKSINAIRTFPGQGVMVWGARTLDGNSDDWRYINVRRTLIFIEQSLKLAARAYVFEPNTASTWSLMTSMINNFLTNLWTQGAVVGATPAQAFSVLIGLGLTMTPQDILEGKLIISIRVAISRPAEFIIINIQQQQQTS